MLGNDIEARNKQHLWMPQLQTPRKLLTKPQNTQKMVLILDRKQNLKLHLTLSQKVRLE